MKPDEIRLPDNGEIAIVVYVFRKKPEGKTEAPSGSNGSGNGKSEPKKADGGEKMTDAQKNYLFRLLAEQGIEGDKAYDHLKNLFGVQQLKDAGKAEASKAIQDMLDVR